MAANVEKSFIMQRYGSFCFLIKSTIGLQSVCNRSASGVLKPHYAAEYYSMKCIEKEALLI